MLLLFIQLHQILKFDVRFMFEWRKWLFWRKYNWQWRFLINHSSVISVWSSTKEVCGDMSYNKETKHIFTSAANLLHIRIRNLNLCKCKHCKSEARETYCLCCRKVDAMLIASAKPPGYKRNISPSSFYGQLPNY